MIFLVVEPPNHIFFNLFFHENERKQYLFLNSLVTRESILQYFAKKNFRQKLFSRSKKHKSFFVTVLVFGVHYTTY